MLLSHIFRLILHLSIAALLKLSENKYTSHLSPPSPVCLPINNGLSTETFLGIRCVATGWGQMAVGGKLQTKLREVELRVIDNKHCRDMYGLMHNIAIQNYHLCAGPILQGGKGTCIVRRHILFKCAYIKLKDSYSLFLMYQ